MKILISIIVATALLLLLYFGARQDRTLHWLPFNKPTTENTQDVKTDTDIHDAIDFVK